MFENRDAINQEIEQDKKADVELTKKVHIMNINEDPFLTGQIKHPVKEGDNIIGKPGKVPPPDIPISGIGVVPGHCQMKFDEANQVLMLHPHEKDSTKNKTYLNGDLVTVPLQIQHGDRILFGNNNLYIVIFPPMPIDESLLDFEEAMKEILASQIDHYKDEKYQKEMDEKLKKLQEEMDKEKTELDNKFKDEQGTLDADRIKLEEEMKNRDEELKRKLDEAYANNNQTKELEERLKAQEEEVKRLGEAQKERERKFIEERNKAIKELEQQNLKKEREKLHLLTLEGLQDQLAKMIIMCNEANEVASSLGREKYFYEPFIETVVMPDGSTKPKVFCKAYPDKNNEFNNVLAFDEMEDKMYRIRDKWEEYQYDVDHDGPNSNALNVDEYEGEIWGLMITDDWQLIGNMFLYFDSLALFMGTPSDEAPIYDTKGVVQGKVAYSLEFKIYDGKTGKEKDCFLLDSLKDVFGDDMEVSFSIHQAKNLPEVLCRHVFCEYQWIDDRATVFETDRVKPKKNDTSPTFNYKKVHDLKIDNYIVENLGDLQCIVSVYGKMTEDNMQGLYTDFTNRPETSNFQHENTEFKSNAIHDAASKNRKGDNGTQDYLKIDSNTEDEEEKQKRQEGEQRAKNEIEQELERIMEQNAKLKKDIKIISKENGSGCCTIF
jgi:kinesin family protein 13